MIKAYKFLLKDKIRKMINIGYNNKKILKIKIKKHKNNQLMNIIKKHNFIIYNKK